MPQSLRTRDQRPGCDCGGVQQHQPASSADPPEARIHGIITHGGDAPNVIPEYTAGMYYVRAASRKYRDEVLEKVKKCLEAGLWPRAPPAKLK